MIAVDTSALMAIVLDEARADDCDNVLRQEAEFVISAGTLAEAMIVSDARNMLPEMMRLIDGLGFDVIPVTAATASRVSQAYRRWGKGYHAANLNFGDCFSYDAAKVNDCPLLFVGDDFRKTDIRPAL